MVPSLDVLAQLVVHRRLQVLRLVGVNLPLGIEGDVSRNSESVVSGISSTLTVRLGIPAGELIAGLFQIALAKHGHLGLVVIRTVHVSDRTTSSAVALVSHGVFIDLPLGVEGLVTALVGANAGHLRGKIIIAVPALEGIPGLGGRCEARNAFAIGISRRVTVSVGAAIQLIGDVEHRLLPLGIEDVLTIVVVGAPRRTRLDQGRSRSRNRFRGPADEPVARIGEAALGIRLYHKQGVDGHGIGGHIVSRAAVGVVGHGDRGDVHLIDIHRREGHIVVGDLHLVIGEVLFSVVCPVAEHHPSRGSQAAAGQDRRLGAILVRLAVHGHSAGALTRKIGHPISGGGNHQGIEVQVSCNRSIQRVQGQAAVSFLDAPAHKLFAGSHSNLGHLQ